MNQAVSAAAFVAAFVTFTAGVEQPGPRRVFPNDPLFRNQLSFYYEGGTTSFLVKSTTGERRRVTVASGVSLDLPRAWAITTGSRSVVVAVLDDGFDYAHEDLAANVWRNRGETGLDSAGLDRSTNARDDDGNGYVDDVVGYDFAFDDPDPDGYVFDGMDATRIQPYRHSNPVLGIIGAAGNNRTGVAGINWRVSLMLLKIGAQGIARITSPGRRDRECDAAGGGGVYPPLPAFRLPVSSAASDTGPPSGPGNPFDFGLRRAVAFATRTGAHPVRGKGRAHPEVPQPKHELLSA